MNVPHRLLSLLVLSATLAATLCACATEPSVFLHPNVDLTTVQRVAVVPFDNLTTDRFAAERVRQVLSVELLAQGAFDVVEIGEVNRVLRARNIENVANLGPEMIKTIGTDLKVQALMFGTVIDYGEHRTGSFTAPEIAIAIRLIDVESGTVMWSVSDARIGLGLWTRLFGVGEESKTEAIQKLLRELLPSLFA